jgi:hypothetical protein
VSEVEIDGARWHRLYLTGGHDFFQAYLDDHDQPEECRYFSLLDEVTPASEEEWSFWLDETEGVIGWPEFQTKDGYEARRTPARAGGAASRGGSASRWA